MCAEQCRAAPGHHDYMAAEVLTLTRTALATLSRRCLTDKPRSGMGAGAWLGDPLPPGAGDGRWYCHFDQ
jgi:hypothetical protein